MKTGTLVLVEWRDTEHEARGWREPADLVTRPLRYRTVGFLARVTRRWVVLSPTHVSDGRYSSSWRIPRGTVRRIRRVR